MSWTTILPKEIDIKNLNLDECRNFKKIYALLTELTEKVGGPPASQIFHRFKLHLLFYGICCLEEKTYPALNNCWNELAPHFLTLDYDNEWLVYYWMFCDFPLKNGGSETILDHFYQFVIEGDSILVAGDDVHYEQCYRQLKASRLGFYQEILSTTKVTKYKELFTGQVISTVRSMADYEKGGIFLGRIVSYLGDAFLLHHPEGFPAFWKSQLEDVIRSRLCYIAETDDESADYQQFMKLAGPFLMFATHNDAQAPKRDPDEYKRYYYGQ